MGNGTGAAPETKQEPGSAATAPRGGRNFAVVVASGILLSRITGLVRESIFAHFFGNSAAADAFKAAFRIPNILQNLFGEGVLSASFIPVYSKLLGEGEAELGEALAWTLGAILSLTVSILVMAGIAAAPYLIDVIAPGFTGQKRELTITLVRIFFPGAGLLVMSAWCLGILNSHHRFFAAYVAPVAWNSAIIATMLIYGPGSTEVRLAELTAVGSVVGSGLQIVVQLPQTLRLVRRLRVDFVRTRQALTAVLNNFTPVVAGRGVIQISAYVDNLLASLLPTGAVAAFNYAQILYMLPVSLFGFSVAAAELPTMSRTSGAPPQVAEMLRRRLDSGLRQIAFMVVPSAAAFVLLGDVIAAAIFQSGHFTHADAVYVWSIMAGSAVGLLAVTMGRLYSSAFYALWDTRTPLKFAVIRVSITTVLGYVCAIVLPPALGIAHKWGVAGLTLSSGLAGWLEFTLLRLALNRRIGATGLEKRYLLTLWSLAIAAAAVGFLLKIWIGPGVGPRLLACAVLPGYGLVYLGAAYLLGIPEFEQLAGRVLRRKL